jgi:hypothetical protein
LGYDTLKEDVRCYNITTTYRDNEILFIHSGLVGGIVVRYYVLKEKPSKKFVELNKMLTDFRFVDAVGANPQCIYIPIVKLKDAL